MGTMVYPKVYIDIYTILGPALQPFEQQIVSTALVCANVETDRLLPCQPSSHSNAGQDNMACAIEQLG